MRPSSSPSDGSGAGGGPGDGLLAPLFGSADVDATVSDASLLQAMLDAERGLARAEADRGVVPREAAEAIAAACDARRFDPVALGRDADASGNPVVPLVRALAAHVPAAARPWVHHGATSQDILDTALVLVVARALDVLTPTLDASAAACAGLVEAHRATLMPARTLGQNALPTTFGLVAAGWLDSLGAAADRLDTCRAGLSVQLGGAAGTLAGLGPAGVDVVRGLAAHLGLAEPTLPWHTHRQRILDIAGALGGAIAAAGKVALDVTLLARTEVGEVTEGGAGRGGSSALPHKQNPVDAVLVVAAARRAPGLVGTLHAAALHEHERATGSWHAEWEPLRELVRLTGSAVARTRRLLHGLDVHADRMRANLDASGGLLMAESVASRLAPALGRTEAHDRVAELSRAAIRNARSLRAELLADDEVRRHLDVHAVDEALDPAGWLGSAAAFTDRALAVHRARRDRRAHPTTGDTDRGR